MKGAEMLMQALRALLALVALLAPVALPALPAAARCRPADRCRVAGASAA